MERVPFVEGHDRRVLENAPRPRAWLATQHHGVPFGKPRGLQADVGVPAKEDLPRRREWHAMGTPELHKERLKVGNR